MRAVVELIAVLLAGLLTVEGARAAARSRRSRRLHRAMHELRRPLQSLALALSRRSPDVECARACLEQVDGALAGLDAAIAGRRVERELAPTPLADVVDSLARRWRWAGVEVARPDGAVVLAADPVGLGAALDNLVANALDHGEGPVEVRALSSAGAARLEVRDRGGRRGGEGARGRDPRRGHGLAVAAELAARQGGALIPPGRGADGATVAGLSLPALGGDRS